MTAPPKTKARPATRPPGQIARWALALSLLEQGDLSIEDIARRVGWTRRQLVRKIEAAAREDLLRRLDRLVPRE
jgi:hypothetical protein